VTAAAAVGILPTGVFPTASLRRFPSPGDETEWPQQLWIPSVGLDDAKLVVFGRDRIDVPVADALEASSAVPGMFQPKLIDGQRFVDGAVRSATNADLLLDQPPGLIVISSPMTRPGRGPVRVRARIQLRREADSLRAAGNTVIVMEPSQQITSQAEEFPRNKPERAAALIDMSRDLALGILGR
jgi:predicted acylesterase/phospholipase RssA